MTHYSDYVTRRWCVCVCNDSIKNEPNQKKHFPILSPIELSLPSGLARNYVIHMSTDRFNFQLGKVALAPIV